jgi:hypothetical protein
MAVSALLALAIVFFWSPDAPGSALPHNHELQLAHQSHDARAVGNSRHWVIHINLVADRDASEIECCLLKLRHPGISVDPHDMPIFAHDNETTAASAVQGLGSDPGVILPRHGLPRSDPSQNQHNQENLR